MLYKVQNFHHTRNTHKKVKDILNDWLIVDNGAPTKAKNYEITRYNQKPD